MTAAVEAKNSPSKKGIKSALKDVKDNGERSKKKPHPWDGDKTKGGKSSPTLVVKDIKDVKDKDEKSSRGTTWMGTEKKKPRAEYQSKINELKEKMAALEIDRDQLTQQVNSISLWMCQAPSAV